MIRTNCLLRRFLIFSSSVLFDHGGLVGLTSLGPTRLHLILVSVVSTTFSAISWSIVVVAVCSCGLVRSFCWRSCSRSPSWSRPQSRWPHWCANESRWPHWCANDSRWPHWCANEMVLSFCWRWYRGFRTAPPGSALVHFVLRLSPFSAPFGFNWWTGRSRFLHRSGTCCMDEPSSRRSGGRRPVCRRQPVALPSWQSPSCRMSCRRLVCRRRSLRSSWEESSSSPGIVSSFWSWWSRGFRTAPPGFGPLGPLLVIGSTLIPGVASSFSLTTLSVLTTVCGVWRCKIEDLTGAGLYSTLICLWFSVGLRWPSLRQLTTAEPWREGRDVGIGNDLGGVGRYSGFAKICWNRGACRALILCCGLLLVTSRS